ncbi:hypothetical protein GC093_32350 [Paenibacillus sp. LMG 31456]|uniref:Uncharacterized protein n=1 Tax=Paenibacillus foliorum TaxID=2654974 RepID=A0A972K5D3_9BACL|nr:hypothetical protein [Paenibacillus foliorum]NOU97883.1 hypothetical protein [Paenibacillus foliorum]
MKKRFLWISLILLTVASTVYLFFVFQTKTHVTPIDPQATQAIDETGNMLLADEFQLFSVNSKTKLSKRILHTEQSISSICYTSEHTVVTVYNANDPKAFKGFYLRDKQADSFIQYPTPQLSPKFSYLFGDVLFLVSADKTAQKSGDFTKVALYDVLEHKWLKEWFVPGSVESVKGSGRSVYFVTSNNIETSSNLYKADVLSGEWDKQIQEGRRYPLDQVALDTNGDIYMMISERSKNEWSNKIYKYNPKQTPYELTKNFVSNTKPYSYSMVGLQGKMLIVRYDLSNINVELDRPLGLLDLKTRKQIHLAWEHRPVDADVLSNEFVVLAEDGTLAFVGLDAAADQPLRELSIPEITTGKRIAVKK